METTDCVNIVNLRTFVPKANDMLHEDSFVFSILCYYRYKDFKDKAINNGGYVSLLKD